MFDYVLAYKCVCVYTCWPVLTYLLYFYFTNYACMSLKCLWIWTLKYLKLQNVLPVYNNNLYYLQKVGYRCYIKLFQISFLEYTFSIAATFNGFYVPFFFGIVFYNMKYLTKFTFVEKYALIYDLNKVNLRLNDN